MDLINPDRFLIIVLHIPCHTPSFHVSSVCSHFSLGLSNQMFPALTTPPAIGELVLAKYDLDEYYYRAVVQQISEGELKYTISTFFSRLIEGKLWEVIIALILFCNNLVMTGQSALRLRHHRKT